MNRTGDIEPTGSSGRGTRADRRARHVNRLLLSTVCLALVAAPVGAQQVLGPWEDATIAPRGMLRLGIGVHFGDWNERYGAGGERTSLGAPFSRTALDATALPGFAPLAANLPALTGGATPALSLGALTTRIDVTEARTPISIDFGLTSRLGLFALVPYVKNRVHVLPTADGTAAGTNLGLNPAWAFEGARTRNGAVVNELSTAATTLEAELARCMGSTDPSCDLVNADRAGAAALAAQANATATALANVFGTASVTGSAYAPLSGSDVHTAVDARLAALSNQFESFLGTAPAGSWVASRPVAAPPLAAAGFDALLGDSAYGIGARVLSDYEHSNVGDIEVGAKFLIADSFTPAGSGLLPRRGALRLAVAGLVRLPTGQQDLPYDFTDIGTGDGQTDLELRGYLDVALAPRLWASAIGRYTLQRPDELVRRITDGPDEPFPEFVREQVVSRDLGDGMEFELAPRYAPNDAFAFSARYRYRTRGEDTYRGRFDVTLADGTPVSIDAGAMGAGTSRTDQLLGFAVTLSTIRGYALRQARWPMEVSLVHTRTIGGEGVPALRAFGISMRFYRSVRGNPIRPTAR